MANDAVFAAVKKTGAREELDVAIDHVALLSEEQDAQRINVSAQAQNAAQHLTAGGCGSDH